MVQKVCPKNCLRRLTSFNFCFQGMIVSPSLFLSIHIKCSFAFWHFKLQGEIALRKYPSLTERIHEVAQQGSFEVEDVQWIARCLGCSVRVSMPYSTWTKIKELQPVNILNDMIIGDDRQVGPHLYFSYEKATEEERWFGHWSVLVPGCGMKWFAAVASLQHSFLQGPLCYYIPLSGWLTFRNLRKSSQISLTVLKCLKFHGST